MSRYNSLCVFLVISTLFGSTVAAPKEVKEGESCSGAGGVDEGSYSGVKNLGTKLEEGFFVIGAGFTSKVSTYLWPTYDSNLEQQQHNYYRFQFEDVTYNYSEDGSEKGTLKAVTDGLHLIYTFYPDNTEENEQTTGAERRYKWPQKDIVSATRSGAVVKLEVEGENEYSLTFANEDNAVEFFGQVSHLMK